MMSQMRWECPINEAGFPNFFLLLYELGKSLFSGSLRKVLIELARLLARPPSSDLFVLCVLNNWPRILDRLFTRKVTGSSEKGRVQQTTKLKSVREREVAKSATSSRTFPNNIEKVCLLLSSEKSPW